MLDIKGILAFQAYLFQLIFLFLQIPQCNYLVKFPTVNYKSTTCIRAHMIGTLAFFKSTMLFHPHRFVVAHWMHKHFHEDNEYKGMHQNNLRWAVYRVAT